jgi:beta-galactosidase
MPRRYPPVVERFPHFLHGGDYNPDQWLHMPEIIDEDFRLAKLARVNSFSVGIFSWMSLEPEEGVFTFDWLDRLLDRMAEENMVAVLATPSGARPAWMSFKYPEVLRVRPEGIRNRHNARHNHCMTSPVYREKVGIINGKLAERYHDHPALGLWHLSNEYGGECHCPLCYAAFREWLKQRYGTLDALNEAWWSTFWSHRYSDWDQIEPQDGSVHGLMLDWMRFVTDQTVDFMKHEIAALRQFDTKTPCTTNMMGTFKPLNYWRFAPEVDVISWDCYPSYHDRPNQLDHAAHISLCHDLNRSMRGGQPFMLMESSPSAQNWQEINKLKSPGVLKLVSLQAIAHGADTIQYFQYRKSRGSAEKFHGAVIDHEGTEKPRVFREVAEVGQMLENLDEVIGTTVPAETALIFDWENWWAIEEARGPRRDKQYMATCVDHYRTLWSKGVPVNVIDSEQPFDGYKLLVAPMLYMLRPGVASRIAEFVRKGGTFVATYLTGIADESDLCFLGGWPGPLREVLGIWAEEIDVLYDDEANTMVLEPGNPLGLTGEFAGRTFCDQIHAETAQVLATYGQSFYAGSPCLTMKEVGSGKAYYLATRAERPFLSSFYDALLQQAGVSKALDTELPEGVTAQVRTDGDKEFLFLLNFLATPAEVCLGDASYVEVLSGDTLKGRAQLAAHGSMVLRKE